MQCRDISQTVEKEAEMRRRTCGSVLVAAAFSMVAIMLFADWVQAEIKLTDSLSVTGFLRHEIGIHTAGSNPNNPGQDAYDFSMSRSWFQSQWTYQPWERLKAFANIRLMWDQTDNLDSNLRSYDAFPLDVEDDEWTLMKSSDDHFSAEVWELYGDLTVDKLWLRAGRQQIAWGEMIGTRVLDVINPLDYSRNFIFDPEEFEYIRIPEWMLRGRYQFGQIGSWMDDFMVEGYINPGDVIPNIYADSGAPLNIMGPFPPFVHISDEDRRGDAEGGVRIGGMISGFYLTLNYLMIHSHDFVLNLTGITRPPRFSVDVDARYPAMHIYGLTGNYFIAPVNTVATLEAAWIPDQPYQDASAPGGLGIEDQGTFNYSIRFDRQTFVFPRPTSSMMIQLQFQQIIREGEEDDILGPNGSKIDKTDEFLFLVLDQYFHHDTYETVLQVGYDFDGGLFVKPTLKYNYRNKWLLALYYVSLSGSEDRPGRFGNIGWMDEFVVRLTYQF